MACVRRLSLYSNNCHIALLRKILNREVDDEKVWRLLDLSTWGVPSLKGAQVPPGGWLLILSGLSTCIPTALVGSSMPGCVGGTRLLPSFASSENPL
jgi:hypothetical protein